MAPGSAPQSAQVAHKNSQRFAMTLGPTDAPQIRLAKDPIVCSCECGARAPPLGPSVELPIGPRARLPLSVICWMGAREES
eukprot:4352605-Pyramimonas_sp.AAC.1